MGVWVQENPELELKSCVVVFYTLESFFTFALLNSLNLLTIKGDRSGSSTAVLHRTCFTTFIF